MQKKENDYTIASVTRALEILELFDQDHKELTLTEISSMAGVNKSSVLRVLATLEQAGFVKHNPQTRQYRLGIVVYKLASSAFDFLDIKELARDTLKAIATETGFMLHLAVIEENEIYVIDKVYPVQNHSAMEMVSRVGGVVPLHCTGVGKVLCAFCEPATRMALLDRCGFEEYTPSTITRREEFEVLLSQVRAQGFAVNNCEHEPFLRCVTFPIFNHRGSIVAAVSMTGLEQVMHEEQIEECKRILKQATNQLSQELGYK